MIRIIKILILIGLGLILGWFLFSQTQTRTPIAIHDCSDKCFKTEDILGLLVSVGVQKFADYIPSVIRETDKTIVIPHPQPTFPLHYLVIPKKDIKDISQISEENKEYLDDAYAVMSEIIVDKKLTKYKIITNGPGYQQATYLHFHLVAELPK